uniref:Ribonuclease H2 subunit B n=1 Tax=Aceria tosichella TaxID=561515 RepID=A0A6G1S9F5_9ACAR
MDVLIVPKECKKLVRVTLPNPRDGKPQHFLCDEENLSLYEIIKFSEKYRAWLIDNMLCPAGDFSMLTKMDPLFVFVPILMKLAHGRFRPLHDICQEFATDRREFSALECALSPYIYWPSICDTQDIDGELFVKFSETKTIDWLVKKHDKLMGQLRTELGDKASKATIISQANDLISDYIPESLCDKMKKTVRDKHTIGG